MVSYLDVLTILLIFFLTAAAKGLKKPALDPHQTAASQQTQSAPVPNSAPLQRVPSDSPAVPGVPQNQPEFSESLLALSSIVSHTPKSAPASPPTVKDPEFTGLEKKLKEEGLDVSPSTEAEFNDGGEHAGKGGLIVRLPQAVLFSPGDDRLHRAALVPLRQIAAALRDIPNKVNLAGYADATPVHNRRFHNNWELAAARSLRIMEALTERYRIDPARLSISSYGPLEPKSPNDTRGGRASNRRVEILILSQKGTRSEIR